jgi:hypothetical protein
MSNYYYNSTCATVCFSRYYGPADISDHEELSKAELIGKLKIAASVSASLRTAIKHFEKKGTNAADSDSE